MQTLIVLIILMAFIGFYINNSGVEKLDKTDFSGIADEVLTNKVKEELKETKEEDNFKNVKVKNPVIGSKYINTGFKNNNVIIEKDNSNGGFSYDRDTQKNFTEEWGQQGVEVENEIEPQESSYIKRNRLMKMYNTSISFGKDGLSDNIVNSEPDIYDAKLKDNFKHLNIGINSIRNAQENAYKHNIDIMNTDPNNLLQYSKSKTIPSNFTEGKIKYTQKIDISDGKHVPLNNDIYNTKFGHDITIAEEKQQINKLFLKK